MWPLKMIVLEKWPKTYTLNLQLLHNTKDQQTGLDMWRWLNPQENFYIQKTFYPRG